MSAPNPSGAAKETSRAFSDLSAALQAAQGPRDWLFEGAIEGTPIVVHCGREKGEKSWTWIDAAVACASGGKWLSAFQCKRPGLVIYLDGEYGPIEFARRAARICRGRGLKPEDVLPKVLHYFSWDLQLAPGDEALAWVAGQCQGFKPALIVVDPWRNHLPGEENSTTDTITAMRIVDKLRQMSGATITLVHHLNKAGRQSGARALLTRADFLIEGTDDEDAWNHVRGRTIRAKDPIGAGFNVIVTHENDDDEPKAATVLTARCAGEERPSKAGLGKSARKILGALRDAKIPMGVNDIKRATSMTSGSAVTKALNELRDAGLAEQDSKGKWVGQ